MNALNFSRILIAAAFLASGASAAAQVPPHTGHPQAQPRKQQPPNPSPEPVSKEKGKEKEKEKPSAEDHSAHMPQSNAQDAPKEPIPPLTDADRAAAFPPDLGGHAVHDRAINYFVLFDQLEWQGVGRWRCQPGEHDLDRRGHQQALDPR